MSGLNEGHSCILAHVDHVRCECACGATYFMYNWSSPHYETRQTKLIQELRDENERQRDTIRAYKYATSSSYGKLAREYEKTQSMRMVTVVGDGVDQHVDCDLYTDDLGKSWMISVGEGSGGSVLLTNAQVSELFEFFIRNTEL